MTLAQHSAQSHITPGAVCAQRKTHLCYSKCLLHSLCRVWLKYLGKARFSGKRHSSMLCDPMPFVCLSCRQAVVVFDNVGSGFVIGIKANNVGGVTRLRKGTTINCFQLRYRGGWYTAVGKVCAANGAAVCHLASCTSNADMWDKPCAQYLTCKRLQPKPETHVSLGLCPCTQLMVLRLKGAEQESCVCI